MNVNDDYLDTVSNEAEDSTKPEETSEAREEILTELDPLWSGGRRSELVETMLLVTSLGLGGGQTLGDVSAEPLA